MKVEELIIKLQGMPKDSEVCVYSEGCSFPVDQLYESKRGDTILISNGETVSDIDCFPKDESIGLHKHGVVYFQDEYKGDLT